MTSKRFILRFPPTSSEKPYTYHLIKDYNLKINILRAAINEGKEGRLLIEVDAEAENLEKALSFLENEGVIVKPINEQMHIDLERCVSCGACTAVCFSGALSINRETWELNFDSEKCVVCGLCLTACPLKLISTGF